MSLALALLLCAAPKADKSVGTKFSDFDRIAVRVLNVGVPTCTTDDLLCSPKLSFGSGLLFQQRGAFYVATNGHVVERAQAITVLSRLSAEPLAASVVAADNRRDVALLKLQAADITGAAQVPRWEELEWLDLADDVDPLGHADLKQLKKGDPVVSLGFPLDPGQPDAERRDGRFTRWYRDDARGRWLLQTDIEFLPGTSGGPLLTPDGKLAGMVAMRTTSGGIGLAVPGKGVQLALTEALKLGTAEKAPFSAQAHRGIAAGSAHLQRASYLLSFKFPPRSGLRACAGRDDRLQTCEVLESARDHLRAAHEALATVPKGEAPPVLMRLLDLWVRYRLVLLTRFAVEPFITTDGRDAALSELDDERGELVPLAASLKSALPPRHPSVGFVETLAGL